MEGKNLRHQLSGYGNMRVENGELAVPVNNTLVRHTAFLAADTQPCVLILLDEAP